ncbi:hypothetical protein [Chelatococcus asaccharovorans]|uniref:Uncharacterized protein n=1 Tax=Chelatococcus asaccharovorans TaxID=28210 RepID=A0A2V3TRC6_9HYPH|nr:hypothetical protein [Chelatococcus asaccharovorans]MBS7707900.1 hypothetical protein [Chelatococcus asaccharovorans]PXW51150.1 hypothetical protein C7450_12141 [Chelatococcus asaccharovorans]PZR85421.1 MAG: hypothetical protein DI537_30830 [Stutzerimonas stutzeri]
MALTVRAFLKFILSAFAIGLGGMGASATEGDRHEVTTLSNLIGRLRSDAALRARFAGNPRGTLSEHGIDPSPYNLPDAMNAEQMGRLLAQNSPALAPNDEPPPAPQRPAAPAAVYGPPPRTPVQEPAPPVPQEKQPLRGIHTIIYGPPPGPRK